MTSPEPLTLSLVVNTTDRAGPLHTLLRALEHQSYPHFEVIVVVGPTHDNTLEVLAPYRDRVTVLRCPTANLSRSRNIGLLAARGDIVAFIDDDAVPAYHWCAQLARLFADPAVAGTGGVVYLVNPQMATIQHQVGICSSLAEYYDVRPSWLTGLVPPGQGRQWCPRMMGTNMAYRRQALVEVGGFDEFYVYIAEEPDLAQRMTQAGHLMHPVFEAPVYHAPASSRNRQVGTLKARFWMQTRSTLYYAIKNGRAAGDRAGAIATQCRKMVLGHWDWFGQMVRAGKMTLWDYVYLNLQEARVTVEAVWHGLARPRQTIAPARRQAALASAAPIAPYQNLASADQPIVDPVSGREPATPASAPPLRLCLLSSLYPPANYDGIGRLTHLMAQGLFELGHTVHVITRGEREVTQFYDGAYVHTLPLQLTRYARYRGWSPVYYPLNYSHNLFDKIKRLQANDGIQLVDSPIWQFEGLVAARSGRLPVAVRLVTSSRQVAAIQETRDPGLDTLGEMEQALLDRATLILPNTQATLRTVGAAYRLPADRPTVCVPYGLVPAPEADTRPFDPARPPATLTVLYVGRLEKRKGVLDLFHAIPTVLARVPAARFVLAGADNSAHDGFRQRTGLDYPTYFARQHPELAERVTFLGSVDDARLQALYQACDLFVAPSLYESFGLIYLEAMNYAKPVVGCAAGGVPEVVAHGETGLLVAPEAPAALAEALITLLGAPARLREMGLAGRRRLLEKFTHLEMARRFADAYRQAIHFHAAHGAAAGEGQSDP